MLSIQNCVILNHVIPQRVRFSCLKNDIKLIAKEYQQCTNSYNASIRIIAAATTTAVTTTSTILIISHENKKVF